MLSKTEDFPELCNKIREYEFKRNQIKHRNWDREREREIETCPPTTATEGRDSHRVGRAVSPPWSPRTVQALWILLTSPIKPSIVVMHAKALALVTTKWELDSMKEGWWRKLKLRCCRSESSSPLSLSRRFLRIPALRGIYMYGWPLRWGRTPHANWSVWIFPVQHDESSSLRCDFGAAPSRVCTL